MNSDQLIKLSIEKTGQEKLPEIKVLIKKQFNISEIDILLNKTVSYTPLQFEEYLTYLERLKADEPVSYITGEREFYSRSFKVAPGVLIPRPETEHLIEHALSVIKPGMKLLDIGTGSGIIPITLALESDIHITSIDINKEALRIAEENVRQHNISEKVTLINGNLWPESKEKFDTIVSNPPYINQKDYDNLDSTVRNYEPPSALVSGPTGLEIVEKIIEQSPDHLKTGGHLIMEIGYDQAQTVAEMCRKQFDQVTIIKDYSGIERIVSARYGDGT